ncbi:unnamed protein product [Rhizoctonia solani]|uniref:DUF6532 domain-containing protein n=1 Tax=Rhizoctonia solani TaxID=456999 RepID=A0A8H3DKK8_9AGAM|nr:unnamed protein product [Rhizoctonia solani]
MPSATRRDPITSAPASNPDSTPAPNASDTGGYNTRKKAHMYSHIKAPSTPPPRPAKRQVAPVSVACKRQRVDTGPTTDDGNYNTGLNFDQESETISNKNTAGGGSISIPPNQTANLSGGAYQQAIDSNTGGLSTSLQTSDALYNTVPSDLSNLGIKAPEPELHKTTTQNGNSAKQSTGTELQPPMTQQPPRSSNDQTGTQPSVKIEGTDQDILHPEHPSQIPSRDPSNLATHWNPSTNSAIATGSIRDSSDVISEAQTGGSNSLSHSNPHHSRVTASEGATMGPTSQAQFTPLIRHTSTSNFSRMYNTIRQTLLPAPSATRSLDSSTAMVCMPSPNVAHPSYAEPLATSGTILRSHSASSTGGAHSHAGSVTRANSLAHDDWNSREGSMTRDSPTSSTISSQPPAQISSSHNRHQDVRQPRRSRRQRDFTYEQLMFMKAMNKRWHWYLISDDSFPINTGMALELCAQYAEQTLELSRKACDIGRPSFDFVRKKDSSIRNSFQTGLLSILEEGYNVNTETTDRLNELISQSNFIYAQYDIETKKVSGRYRHPCLLRVLGAVLFTKSKRGHPIGVCFMPEIMGGTDLTDSPEQLGGTGITVAMVALACTLVLHGLKSIKAGDSSQRLGTRKEKPVHFTEKKYSSHYRNFVSKLKEYNRFEEVQKAYLEEIMREYLQLHIDENEDSDGNIEVDDEMHSDGE